MELSGVNNSKGLMISSSWLLCKSSTYTFVRLKPFQRENRAHKTLLLQLQSVCECSGFQNLEFSKIETSIPTY